MTQSDNINDKISKAIGVDFETKQKSDIVPKKEPKEITVPPHELAKLRDKQANADYGKVREGITDLIDVGKNAIDGIMKVATEGDHPRAYEVAATLLKTVADMNKDLIDLHQKMNDMKKEERISQTNHTTNNSIYVGSTSDLQDIINQARSTKKAVQDNIIDAGPDDVEVIENGDE